MRAARHIGALVILVAALSVIAWRVGPMQHPDPALSEALPPAAVDSPLRPPQAVRGVTPASTRRGIARTIGR